MIYVRDFHQKFMISWFVTVCVHNFPRREVLVKVDVMEFEFLSAYRVAYPATK